jgi:hypothetical protein
LPISRGRKDQQVGDNEQQESLRSNTGFVSRFRHSISGYRQDSNHFISRCLYRRCRTGEICLAINTCPDVPIEVERCINIACSNMNMNDACDYDASVS